MFEYTVLWVEFERETDDDYPCATVTSEQPLCQIQRTRRETVHVVSSEWPQWTELEYVRPIKRLSKRNGHH